MYCATSSKLAANNNRIVMMSVAMLLIREWQRGSVAKTKLLEGELREILGMYIKWRRL